jgi:hypothetical protein
MKTETYKCDECNTEREAANHWFGIVLKPKQLLLEPLDPAVKYTFHLCGENCATKIVSRFFTSEGKAVI